MGATEDIGQRGLDLRTRSHVIMSCHFLDSLLAWSW